MQITLYQNYYAYERVLRKSFIVIELGFIWNNLYMAHLFKVVTKAAIYNKEGIPKWLDRQEFENITIEPNYRKLVLDNWT